MEAGIGAALLANWTVLAVDWISGHLVEVDNRNAGVYYTHGVEGEFRGCQSLPRMESWDLMEWLKGLDGADIQ